MDVKLKEQMLANLQPLWVRLYKWEWSAQKGMFSDEVARYILFGCVGAMLLLVAASPDEGMIPLAGTCAVLAWVVWLGNMLVSYRRVRAQSKLNEHMHYFQVRYGLSEREVLSVGKEARDLAIGELDFDPRELYDKEGE